MKKVVLSTLAAVALSTSAAFAADLPVKAVPIAAPPPPAFDLAFGAAIASDYVFRGVSQSNRKPSASAYFEPRWNLNPDWQLYVGIAGLSISLPNRPAAEVDLYGGVRATFGKLQLDVGLLYYWYPGSQCFNTAALCASLGGNNFAAVSLPNGNTIKADIDFLEFYAKATYNITDAFVIGAGIAATDSVLNSGASGVYYSANAKYTFPAFANGIAVYVSGEVGHWAFGTTDAFYGPIALPDYTHWNAGIGLTYKVFALDFRYHDTNLNRGDCNAFTGDHTASGTTNVTAINPLGLGSRWCSSAFVVKLSVDATAVQNLK